MGDAPVVVRQKVTALPACKGTHQARVCEPHARWPQHRASRPLHQVLLQPACARACSWAGELAWEPWRSGEWAYRRTSWNVRVIGQEGSVHTKSCCASLLREPSSSQLRAATRLLAASLAALPAALYASSSHQWRVMACGSCKWQRRGALPGGR